MSSAEKKTRIIVVDCLRRFAVFGLFIVHMVEYFELYWYLPEPGIVHNLIFFLFGGKAYAIFALLFGLSFFIIMENQAKRGVDFRARFSWRLTLLCFFRLFAWSALQRRYSAGTGFVGLPVDPDISTQ